MRHCPNNNNTNNNNTTTTNNNNNNNNMNLHIKTEPVLSGFSGICLVFVQDRYTVSSDPSVNGLVFMRRFGLFSGIVQKIPFWFCS